MATNSDLGLLDFETLISTSDVELLKKGHVAGDSLEETIEDYVDKKIEDYVENGIDPLVVSLTLSDGFGQNTVSTQIISHVPQPHLDTFVVCRSKNFFSLNLYEEEESPETVEMDHVDLYFIRYKIVKGPN